MRTNGRSSARWLRAAGFLMTLGAARQAWASGMTASDAWIVLLLYIIWGACIGLGPAAAVISLIILYRYATGDRSLALRHWAIGTGITLLVLVAAGVFALLLLGLTTLGPLPILAVLGSGVLACADFVVAKRVRERIERADVEP